MVPNEKYDLLNSRFKISKIPVTNRLEQFYRGSFMLIIEPIRLQ